MSRKLIALFPPEQIIVFSVLLTIGIGTLLLSLPIAQKQPAPLLDLVFTATSATCVTGLFTLPIDNFTIFGKAVLLALIQIGGLGLITLTLFFMSMFMNIGFGAQLIAGQILELDTWKHMKRILIFITCVTLCAEFIGTLFILGVLNSSYPVGMAWFLSMFHAISSFCSSGITILDGGMAAYHNNYVIMFVTMILMFVGELGFITWQEIGQWTKARWQREPYRFSLHTRIVLYGSTVLLGCTSIIFWILEHNNILANLSPFKTGLDTLFYALSFRSAGFLLTAIASFNIATIMLIIVISFIGASPGSTGSGIKITTFVVFLATIRAAIGGNSHVTIQGRSIAISQVLRAIAIFSIGLGWILLITFCLLITEKGFSFLELLFESVSALTNLGITTGITPRLSTLGKLFIILSMIIGRIGSFTLILALKLRKKPQIEYTYPEERVML